MSKKSLNLVFEAFPSLEKLMKGASDKEINNMNDTEIVFYQLALFFEEPKMNSFDMRLLYLNLKDDWLTFAFECLETFFKEDTFLLRRDYESIIKESQEPLLNQKQFADELKTKGFDMERNKLNVYYKRGKLPFPDQLIFDKPHWYLSTVTRFAEQTDIKKKDQK